MVLVVDDDASVRKALRRLFHATGRNVETFASAAEFLAYDLPPEAGCLVLDIRMPGMRVSSTRHPASGGRSHARNSAALANVSTSRPVAWNRRRSAFRTDASSSTTNTMP